MKALYRRCRPKTLSEVIGQEQVTKVLERALAEQKLSHSYIFVGPRGTGKTSVARILAHEINKFKYELEDDYLDIIEIDAASNNGVDNIRDIREKAAIAPSVGEYKIYIIDEVHMLTKQAFNALLKTLEEPPAHVIFIMATTDAHKIPATITSRSQTLTFKLADPSTMFEHLKKIAKENKIKIDDEALQIIVRRGGGSYRDSLSLLDQISTLSSNKITAEIINNALGLPARELITTILGAYESSDNETVRSALKTLEEQGIQAEITAEDLIREILERPSEKLLILLEKLIDIKQAEYKNIKLLLALIQKDQIPSKTYANSHQTQTSAIAEQIAPNIVQPKPIPQTTKTEKNESKPQISKKLAIEDLGSETESAPNQKVEAELTSKPKTKTAPKEANELHNHLISELENNNQVSILRYIRDAQIDIVDQKVIIYAGTKFNKNQLDKKRQIITEFLASDQDLEIKEDYMKSDSVLTNIAAIMGGGQEVSINE